MEFLVVWVLMVTALAVLLFRSRALDLRSAPVPVAVVVRAEPLSGCATVRR